MSIGVRRSPGIHLAMTLAVCLAALTAYPITAAVDTGQTRFFKYLMGTSVRIEIYGGDAALRQQAADEAFAAVGEVDRLMSDYRADSEVTRVNRSASDQPVVVSAPLMAVLAAGERVSQESHGAFDMTLRPALVLWGFKSHASHIPTREEIEETQSSVGYGHLALDKTTQSVRFTRRGMAVDLGGLAKGFATELAAASLRSRGLSGVIDAGGTQYMVGTPIGKERWSVGVLHPDLPGELLGGLDVADGAVSTTSDTSNLLPSDSSALGRVLDPRNLLPATSSLSATVVSQDGTLANALSRAAFVLGPVEGLALLDRFPSTWGVIAYRQANRSIGVKVSPGHAQAFHPAPAAQ